MSEPETKPRFSLLESLREYWPWLLAISLLLLFTWRTAVVYGDLDPTETTVLTQTNLVPGKPFSFVISTRHAKTAEPQLRATSRAWLKGPGGRTGLGTATASADGIAHLTGPLPENVQPGTHILHIRTRCPIGHSHVEIPVRILPAVPITTPVSQTFGISLQPDETTLSLYENQPFRIQLIPESGEMIQAIDNQLNFRVSDSQNQPLEGIVVITGGVSRVVTDAHGIASVTMPPQKRGETLTISARNADNTQSVRAVHRLPVDSRREGLLIRPETSQIHAGETISFHIHTAEPDRRVFLQLVSNGIALETVEVTLSEKTTQHTFEIPPGTFGLIEIQAASVRPAGEIAWDRRLVQVAATGALDASLDVEKGVLMRPGGLNPETQVHFQIHDLKPPFPIQETQISSEEFALGLSLHAPEDPQTRFDSQRVEQRADQKIHDVHNHWRMARKILFITLPTLVLVVLCIRFFHQASSLIPRISPLKNDLQQQTSAPTARLLKFILWISWILIPAALPFAWSVHVAAGTVPVFFLGVLFAAIVGNRVGILSRLPEIESRMGDLPPALRLLPWILVFETVIFCAIALCVPGTLSLSAGILRISLLLGTGFAWRLYAHRIFAGIRTESISDRKRLREALAVVAVAGSFLLGVLLRPSETSENQEVAHTNQTTMDVRVGILSDEAVPLGEAGARGIIWAETRAGIFSIPKPEKAP